MRPLRAFLRDSRATAGAEMALILPGFAFLFLNVADASIYIYSGMQVDLAAQEAVGVARMLCNSDTLLPATTNCTGLETAMQTAAESTSLGAGVSVGAPTNAWYCSTGGGDLTLVAAIDGTPPADCSATVAGSTAKPGEYLSASASYSFSPIFPGTTVASALPATITRTAWIRLQ